MFLRAFYSKRINNGNLIFKHVIDTISGNRMPYTLELVYNTNDKDLDIGYGKVSV